MIAIREKAACTGCHACANACPQGCISMIADAEGFLYPRADTAPCIGCRSCERACPQTNGCRAASLPQAYAAYNLDEGTRANSSSGGLFTLQAEYVLARNGVVFGAAFDSRFQVKHIGIQSLEDLESLRGSKYVQSAVGSTYREAKAFLEEGRLVLFSGTPCQISGLFSFLNKDYKNLITQDIVCHGVPSPGLWERYVSFRESSAGAAVRRISFRLKSQGWRRFSVSFLFENNTEYRRTFDKDLYMQAFLGNISLRPSCYACQFKTLHRKSDVTLGDFWGIQSVFPEMDDDRGASLILVNSDRGRLLFQEIAPALRYKSVGLPEAIKGNLAAIRSAPMHPNRRRFFEELERVPVENLIETYAKVPVWVKIMRRLKLERQDPG